MSSSSGEEEEEHHSSSGQEQEEAKTKDNLTSKQRKKMKRAAEKLLSGTAAAAAATAPAVMMNTHSQPTVVSAISTAQHKAFGFLKLEEFGPEERRKARTHANPLSKQFLEPTQAPNNFSEWYEDATKPLGIDIGCAGGRFAFMMSCHADSKFPEVNHLGLEIRRALVERANTWAEGKGLHRKMRFVLSSANVSLASVVRGYPGKIAFLCVQFPDPHFKRKHHKRRVVNAEFIEMVASILDEGAWFFVQSDVEEAAAQMRDRIDAYPQFFSREGEYTKRDPLLLPDRVRSGEGEEYWTRDGKRALPAADGSEERADYGDWRIGPNPMGVPTEREVQNEALGLPIYRALQMPNYEIKFNFAAEEPQELSVSEGEIVSAPAGAENSDDPWTLVETVTPPFNRGFVPTSFLLPVKPSPASASFAAAANKPSQTRASKMDDSEYETSSQRSADVAPPTSAKKKPSLASARRASEARVAQQMLEMLAIHPPEEHVGSTRAAASTHQGEYQHLLAQHDRHFQQIMHQRQAQFKALDDRALDLVKRIEATKQKSSEIANLLLDVTGVVEGEKRKWKELLNNTNVVE